MSGQTSAAILGAGLSKAGLPGSLRREGPHRRRFSTRRLAAQTDGTKSVEERSPTPPEAVEAKFDPSEMKPYEIPSGTYFSTFAALLTGALARGACGTFVSGYTRTTAKEAEKPGEYRPFKKLGMPNTVEGSTKLAGFKRPEKPIEIYEYQACPFCAKVREATSVLDLDVMFYPTPRGAPHHRAKVAELGGKQMFPYMVDPNTGISMYESAEIVKYLFKEYGDGQVPLLMRLGPLTNLGLMLISLVRFGRGFNYRQAKYPEKPLRLWAYETSPFSRFVRECMVELELPFLQFCCARGSPKRQELLDRVGHFQAPYLEDPNTGVALFESVEIIKYLEETYAL